MMNHNRRTSILLRQIHDRCGEGTVSVGTFTALLGDRAFALAILIFSLPTVVAGAVPGFSTLTAVPIMLIAAQMALGRAVIWLPRKVAQKEFSQSVLKVALLKTIRPVVWLEKFLRPRMRWVGHPLGERLVGSVIVLLALVLSLPIPGGNLLPSVGISLLALSVLERDGVLAALGLVFIAVGSYLLLHIYIAAFYWMMEGVDWIMAFF